MSNLLLENVLILNRDIMEIIGVDQSIFLQTVMNGIKQSISSLYIIIIDPKYIKNPISKHSRYSDSPFWEKSKVDMLFCFFAFLK